MVKLNSLKLVTILKTLQFIYLIIIFAFLLTIFISSLVLNETKLSLINIDVKKITIGLITISFSNGFFHISLSTFAIIYIVFICLFSCLYIMNMIYLRIKFFYLQHYFKFFLINIILSLILFFLICLISLIKIQMQNFNPTNNSNLNLLINYSIEKLDNNFLLFKSWLSTGGIIFCSIGSIWLLVLFSFPVKITYNLIKIKYI